MNRDAGVGFEDAVEFRASEQPRSRAPAAGRAYRYRLNAGERRLATPSRRHGGGPLVPLRRPRASSGLPGASGDLLARFSTSPIDVVQKPG